MTSQPLTITSQSTGSVSSGPNLVTITSSAVSADGQHAVPTQVSTLPPGSVYVARAPATHGSAGGANPAQLAINLTNTGPAKIISQGSRGQLGGLDHTTSAAQIITSISSPSVPSSTPTHKGGLTHPALP